MLQETLDQLFRERLIPFELTARNVIENGRGEYEVPLTDNRIHSFSFSWNEGDSFKDVLRAAVSDREKTMIDPVNEWIV